jgi:hypothetical protein
MIKLGEAMFQTKGAFEVLATDMAQGVRAHSLQRLKGFMRRFPAGT